ncbi:unnamed protein product [Notodromas monacha]|uniref:Peroxidase n=1 Tax=Notodromas monacha TaxID=399045 RepID=A0A7R9C0N7_9CRUS|nr:unnamed protein product [Notodromas monacha]CAG0924743.1 unnamed protein product [Notodromas monacha]
MALTGFHTMFIREHNRIAEELAKLNPHWDDERIYQESRRIVIAQIQYITYHEYLPVLMGRNWEQEASQFLESKGHKTARRHGYQEDLDPTVANVFAGAAFRFGHATIQGLARIHQAGKRVSAEENIPFHEIQFNSSRMYSPGQMDGLLKGYSEEESRGRGRFFSAQITNHMFETIDSGFGFDLVAVNIQRGRDRGLPPYNDWREYCGLSRIASFQVEETISDLNASTGCTSNLHSLIYKSVDDVDAFSGMISEFRQKGSMLGPTLQCLIGEQFFRSKHGDRFWFDSKSSPYPLTRDQLAAIKKTSLARLICSGSDEMKSLQPTAMLSPNVNRYNKPVKCSDLRPISVVAWEDYQIKSPFKKE